ncbi:MAG: hypothetical protein ACI4VP_01400 [Clostridia bacterium]
MKKIFYTVFFMFIILLVAFSPKLLATTTPDFSLNSEAAFLYDASSRSGFIRKE